ncbi:hypothetical protein NKG05_15540 [Oerskovia sp. M15]
MHPVRVHVLPAARARRARAAGAVRGRGRALSCALALAAKNREWLFWGVQQSLLFPLLILSGMMLPLEAGPSWMQTASKFNP